MAHIRTFVGIKLSKQICFKATKLMRRLESTEAGYNWVDPENLHLTLNFIGDVKDVEVPKFCKEIEQRILETPEGSEGAFEVSLRGCGCFPNQETPRVVWIGLETGIEILCSFNAAIARLISERGIPKDRHEYNPHLTLGRLKKGGRWNDDMLRIISDSENFDGGSCMISEVTVFSSHIDRGSPTHTPMSTIRLG